MNDPSLELDEAAVTAILADLDAPPMPEAVWQRLQAALAVEAGNRAVAAQSHPEPVMPEIEKNELPESQPSAVGEGDE